MLCEFEIFLNSLDLFYLLQDACATLVVIITALKGAMWIIDITIECDTNSAYSRIVSDLFGSLLIFTDEGIAKDKLHRGLQCQVVLNQVHGEHGLTISNFCDVVNYLLRNLAHIYFVVRDECLSTTETSLLQHHCGDCLCLDYDVVKPGASDFFQSTSILIIFNLEKTDDTAFY